MLFGQRQNDLHVEELAKSGILPAALNNFLIFLGKVLSLSHSVLFFGYPFIYL